MLKVLCAIILRHGRVLVTQRSEQMREPLCWEFPGGKQEPGESERACVVREIAEELRLSITPVQRLTPAVHHTPGQTIELIPYLCRYAGGRIHLLEHKAYRWAAPDELLSFDWCPADVPIVAEYLQLFHSS